MSELKEEGRREREREKSRGLCPGGGGVLAYKRLMGMCCWMGSHFHDWIGVAFSKELLEWPHIYD